MAVAPPPLIGTLLLGMVVALGGTRAAAAQEIVAYPEAEIMVSVPTGWLVADEEARLSVSDAGGTLVLTFDLLPEPDLDEALDVLPRLLEREFPEFGFRDLYDEVDLNGLPGVILDAGARLEGRPVDIAILLAETPAMRPVLVIAYAPSRDFALHARTVAAIMKSLRPLDP